MTTLKVSLANVPSATAPRPARGWITLVAGALLVVAMIVSAGLGALPVTVWTTLEALWGGLRGQTAAFDSVHAIVWNLRLPRVFMAALVGASLGCSGAAMQGLFRNPLADPYLLGVASGASFGATLALAASGQLAQAFSDAPWTPGSGSSLLPLFAFLGAVGAVLITLALARAGAQTKASSILLAGIVVGSVLTSLTTYLMMRDADRLRAAFSWALGNLAASSWLGVGRAMPYAVFGMASLCALARGLDALQLGEDTARSLGVDTRRVRFGVIVGASLSTAAAVSFVGIIGFVGLAAPHIMRHLGLVRHRALLPGSALAGATLLVLADLGARVLVRPAELPVGIVTTLVGGPFFLWLLRRRP
jgi:iron complex transport system permease protein